MQVDDHRITAFCSGPVSCAFMLIVEQNGLTPAAAVAPDIAHTVASRAVNAVCEHSGDYDELVAYALSQGPRLSDLAQSLLSQPEAAAWFAPLDREAQMWVGVAGATLDLDSIASPVETPTSWERCAQKSATGLYVSTIIGDLSSFLIAVRESTSDYYDFQSRPVYTRYHLRAASDARVFEIAGPADWHELCTEFPALEPDGKVVPDWSGVARRWDGVHLTLGGMLTANHVKIIDAHRWTQHNGWNAEQTLWLRNWFEAVERLPDLADIPPDRDDIEHWWYWGPTWDDNPKPWRGLIVFESDRDEDETSL